MNPIVSGLLAYLKKTGQMDLLPQLAQEQLRQAKLQLASNTAIVLTTIPLTANQTHHLETGLTQIFHRPIKVVNHLEPQLIAGLKVTVGDKLIDLSLNSKLASLYEKLQS